MSGLTSVQLPEGIAAVTFLAAEKPAAFLVDGTVWIDGTISKVHKSGIEAVSVSPDRTLFATIGFDRTVRCASAEKEIFSHTFQGRGSSFCVAFSTDGRYVAASSGKEITLFSITGEIIQAYGVQESEITALCWNPKAPEVAVALKNKIIVLRPEGKVPRYIFEWPGSVQALAWSPDGKYIACGMSENAVHFWIVAKHKEFQISGFPAKVKELSWHPSSKALVVGGSLTTSLWDFRSGPPVGKEPVLLDAHLDLVSALKFSPKGDPLLSGGADGRVMVWMPGMKEAAEVAIAEESDTIHALEWSTDGKRVIFGGTRGVLQYGSIEELL